MFKKHFNSIILLISSSLAVPLHAAQPNDSQQSFNETKSYIPPEIIKKIANKENSKGLENTKKELEQALNKKVQHCGYDHPDTMLYPISL